MVHHCQHSGQNRDAVQVHVLQRIVQNLFVFLELNSLQIKLLLSLQFSEFSRLKKGNLEVAAIEELTLGHVLCLLRRVTVSKTYECSA